jgi:hypothetical protein
METHKNLLEFEKKPEIFEIKEDWEVNYREVSVVRYVIYNRVRDFHKNV